MSYYAYCIKKQCADECHHRDVNHTFAEMKHDDPNPYVQMHADDAKIAWRLAEEKAKVEAITLSQAQQVSKI